MKTWTIRVDELLDRLVEQLVKEFGYASKFSEEELDDIVTEVRDEVEAIVLGSPSKTSS